MGVSIFLSGQLCRNHSPVFTEDYNSKGTQIIGHKVTWSHQTFQIYVFKSLAVCDWSIQRSYPTDHSHRLRLFLLSGTFHRCRVKDFWPVGLRSYESRIFSIYVFSRFRIIVLLCCLKIRGLHIQKESSAIHPVLMWSASKALQPRSHCFLLHPARGR